MAEITPSLDLEDEEFIPWEKVWEIWKEIKKGENNEKHEDYPRS